MERPQTWAEALNINAEMLSEWSLKAPSDIPVLVWCLENGHVSIEDYLAWACEHYGLPILNTAFFTQSFDRDSLNAEVRGSEYWSPWCFPVGQWEDVTLVACVEPPANRPNYKCAYVLADPAAMHEIWGRNEGGASPTASEPELEAPQGVDLKAQNTFVLNLDNLTSLTTMGEITASAEASDPDSMESKSGLTLMLDNPETHLITPPSESETQGITASLIVETPDEEGPPPVTRTNVKPVKLAPPAPAPAKPKGKPKPLVSDEAEIQTAFALLRKEFQSVMIMKCIDGVAVPYKWDSSLRILENDESTHVNLLTPSFFRIVMKTSHPYHGYVVDSPAHKAFFDALRLPEPPASITAIPLMANGKIWGIMVAFGLENAQGPQTLEHAVKICEKLTSNCAQSWSQAA